MDIQGCLKSLAGGGDEAADRAISPVIAVALMLAITVFLAMSASVFVFDVTSSLESEVPTADFAFKYTENVGSNTYDNYGLQVGNVTWADAGLLTINYQRGDNIDPANLEIQGNTSGGPIPNASGYANATSFLPGYVVNVVAVRGETIQIVWSAPDGSESAVLEEFVVRVPESN